MFIDGVRKSFGGIQAVDGARFQVERGRITGLIGPNGAGKSTLFDIITGVQRADSGKVKFRGEDVTDLASRHFAERGLVRTFQLARELGRLTVLENLMLAPRGQTGERFRPVFGEPRAIRDEDRQIGKRAEEVLAFTLLETVRDHRAQDLSGGQKKLLELARALMLDADVILLDEPGAGVNPALMKTLVDIIRKLNRDSGKTFLIIEHDMDLIAELCDHVVVMTEGRTLVEGTFASVQTDPKVIEAYLGGGRAH